MSAVRPFGILSPVFGDALLQGQRLFDAVAGAEKVGDGLEAAVAVPPVNGFGVEVEGFGLIGGNGV
jgi:hypothetical protein